MFLVVYPLAAQSVDILFFAVVVVFLSLETKYP